MNLFRRKPESLGEVVRRVRAGEQKFDPSLREFLDSFYANVDSRQQALAERPASIDAVHDAYVAAVRRTSCARLRVADTRLERDSW